MSLSFMRRKRMFALLFISFLLLLFYNSQWMGRWMYPVEYEHDIRTAASAQQLDPFLVASIIRVESNFSSDKVSKKGAVGLMQIMPETAQWIAEQPSFQEQSLANLTNPKLNIAVGTWYLGSLMKQFELQLERTPDTLDQIAFIAAAYNAGPGNVGKWLEAEVWDGRYETIAMIPYGETRHYIRRIVYYYKKYQQYYSDIWYN